MRERGKKAREPTHKHRCDPHAAQWDQCGARATRKPGLSMASDHNRAPTASRFAKHGYIT